MRILIIDDDQQIISTLKKNFECENFIVDTATDGQKGSFYARTNSYDIIILDNNLPVKNGLIVCEEIRNVKNNTPIIMLSSCSEISEKVSFLRKGVDDYMTKPYSFEELHARVRAVLRRNSTILESKYTIQDLMIDLNAQEVYKNGVQIYLTRKEFSLLELFIKNNNIVLSRAKIMEHVWNMDSDPFSRTLDTHILNLRKKIESKNGRKLILSISGRGYKVCA